MSVVVDPQRPDLGGNIRHGDANTFAPYLWRYLIRRFAIRSMLDVGCGEGHAVNFFWKEGVFAHGIDGLRSNVERAVVPIALHDILEGPYMMPVDLVWSCEVAEHILPEKVDHYLDTLANGRIVAMTHAVPGQDGHNHVNLQPAEYWTAGMGRRGYVLERSQKFYREIAAKDDVPNYFQMTGMLFVRA
jgi:SAM-dependent methyltransferase